jgi:hypothetical protein
MKAPVRPSPRSSLTQVRQLKQSTPDTYLHQPSLPQPSKVEVVGRFTERVLRDVWGKPGQLAQPAAHLQAALNWLKLAHDASPDQGVSWGYSLRGGWRQLSYRETSGYIAETFFDIAAAHHDADAKQRAIAICHWLTEVQNSDGGFSNPRYTSEGIVFDTGQVLQGLVRGYVETKDVAIGQAAAAAGDWLVRVADETGRWTRCVHNGIPHVYNSRVAWILLQLHQVSPTAEREQVARANLDWAISQQQPSGLFDQCAFVKDVPPFIHTIAYATRGLLEAGLILEEERYIAAADRAARAVMKHVRADGFIPGQLDIDGLPVGNYCCLTGNCQMAIIWLKLFERTRDLSYYNAAKQSLEYVMRYQEIDSADRNIRGGIKGSQPIWGGYTRLSYPNWAAKFFVDALLLLLRLQP